MTGARALAAEARSLPGRARGASMKTPLDILVLYNEPQLEAEHSDAASEAGVLESVDAASAALAAAGHRVRRLGLGRSPAPLLEALSGSSPPSAVVNFFEGFGGVGAGEAQVAALAELLGIPLTGSPSHALALVRDKALTKYLLAGAGLSTPDFEYVGAGEEPPADLGGPMLDRGPCIVKPAHEDASLGLSAASVVTDNLRLIEQVLDIRHRYGGVLVEQFIAGREFNVAVVDLPEPTVLPIAEVEFCPTIHEHERVLTYAAKWDVGGAEDLRTPVRCPAKLEPALEVEIARQALAAYRLTGCRDYGRVDVRVDAEGRVYLLEINGNPDLSPTAGLARALAAAGIPYDRFIVDLVERAAQRGGGVIAERPSLALRVSVDDAQPTPTRSASEGLPRKTPTRSAIEGQTVPQRRTTNQPLRLRAFAADDIEALVDILRRCGEFRPEEVAVGEEVLREAAKPGREDDYAVTVAESAGRAVGWTCHGRVPLTDGTYDLYWVAVAPDWQTMGVGSALLADVERRIAAAGGRWLLAETSAAAPYSKTRAFYERRGFARLSEIADFYRAGDGRVIFGKRLDEPA